MSKKKTGLVGLVKKASKLKSESSFLKKNPPIVTDVFTYVLPAAGAYVATRLAGRAARTFIGAKFPKIAPFAAPLGNLLAFGSIWYIAHKVEVTKKYHNQLMIGAGVAVVQSLVQSVLPGLSWIFDSTPVYALPANSGIKAVSEYEDAEVIDDDSGIDAGLDDTPESVDGEDLSEFQTGVFAN